MEGYGGCRDPTLDAPIRVRVGLAAGEPVTENHDLFGAAGQLSKRICSAVEPATNLVGYVFEGPVGQIDGGYLTAGE